MRATIFLLAVFLSFPVFSQNHHVTFVSSHDTIAVDSILATNLHTDQSIMIPANETLILEQSSGIKNLSNASSKVKLYPNPFDGVTTITYCQTNEGKMIVTIHNHIGQLLCQTNIYLDEGNHSFVVSFDNAGIYFITISGNDKKTTQKAICTKTSNLPVGISHAGNHSNGYLKSGYDIPEQPNEYILSYSSDHVMHFKCFGGKYTTIFTDTVEASIDYEVEFVDCTDPDWRTYNVVKIGDQFWMEENLAYLPEVDSSNKGLYHVYGYEGSSISEAKATENYRVYGVLYNWESAKTACPIGWHLPGDEEYKTLECYLGMPVSAADSSGVRNSGDVAIKLKSVSGWRDNNGGNYSGFNSIPAGYRFLYGGFDDIGGVTYYWSSTQEENASFFWGRVIHSGHNGISRNNAHPRLGFSVRCIIDD
jgi:uncharacterized protein (TIGR02145 family)